MGRFGLWDQRDLDYMREVQEDNMPDTCVVERPTNVSNGKGGYTQTWTTVYSGKCRYWISSGTSGTSTEARHWGEHEIAYTEGFIITPWDTDVRNHDRVTWTQTETGVVRTFQVVGSNKDDSVVTATRTRVVSLREDQ